MNGPTQWQEKTVEELEESAAKLRANFDSGNVKRPLIIEFSGLPKAGKTRTIAVLELFLKRNKFNVEVFIERASIAPIRSKGHLNFNTWVSCASLQGMLEALSKPELDILILDRGIFDALMWTHWLRHTSKITAEEEEACYAFFGMKRWTSLIDLVVVMTCSPAVSMEREYAGQLTTKRGTIMTDGTLHRISESIDATVQRFGDRFKTVEQINTDGKVAQQTAAMIASKTLDALTGFIDEEICVVPAELVSESIPRKGLVSDQGVVGEFVSLVNEHKKFVRRSEAEEDPRYVQPIACAVIRWEDKVLLLQRNKKGHALHHKFLLWAGGHVNVSDDSGDLLVGALERELSEEIFIAGNYKVSEKPLALVRTDESERALRHIGVLYEITLTSADLASTLNREFKETRGTSMSGRLATPMELPEVYEKLNDWSKSMAEFLWPNLHFVTE